MIGSDDVIFKLHAFHISWFSFKSVKVETPQKKKKKEKKKEPLKCALQPYMGTAESSDKRDPFPVKTQMELCGGSTA